MCVLLSVTLTGNSEGNDMAGARALRHTAYYFHNP
jgi:hypothetical protein